MYYNCLFLIIVRIWTNKLMLILSVHFADKVVKTFSIDNDDDLSTSVCFLNNFIK